MDLSKKQVNLVIAGRSYPVQIEPSEEANLLEVVREVNFKVDNFQKKYPQQDKQDILVMTLLTYANDLFESQHESKVSIIHQEMSEKIASVRRLVDEALS